MKNNSLKFIVAAVGFVSGLLTICFFITGIGTVGQFIGWANRGNNSVPVAAAPTVSSFTNSAPQYPGNAPVMIPSYTPYPSYNTDQSTLSNCGGALVPRLTIGSNGRVTNANDSLPNRVREQPGVDSNWIDSISPDTVFRVLAGPICSEGVYWWKIQVIHGVDYRNYDASGTTGWSAEGVGSDYYLEPEPS